MLEFRQEALKFAERIDVTAAIRDSACMNRSSITDAVNSSNNSYLPIAKRPVSNAQWLSRIALHFSQLIFTSGECNLSPISGWFYYRDIFIQIMDDL